METDNPYVVNSTYYLDEYNGNRGLRVCHFRRPVEGRRRVADSRCRTSSRITKAASSRLARSVWTAASWSRWVNRPACPETPFLGNGAGGGHYLRGVL